MSDLAAVAANLPDPYRLLHREQVSSTNDVCLQFAEQGIESGLIVVADQQTQGRGRRGKSWFTGDRKALALSIFIEHTETRKLLSIGIAVAVVKTLKKFGISSEIKWPNDVLCGGKKIAGILIESCQRGSIIGVGLNVNVTKFPEAVEATSMLILSDQPLDRSQVFYRFMEQFDAALKLSDSEIIAFLSENDFLLRKKVQLLIGETAHEGEVLGYTGEGSLLLKTDDEVLNVTQASDIRVML